MEVPVSRLDGVEDQLAAVGRPARIASETVEGRQLDRVAPA